MVLYKLFFFFMMAIMTISSSAKDKKGHDVLVQNLFSTAEHINKKKYSCDSHQCPDFLIDWKEDDKNGLFWRDFGDKSIWQQCHHKSLQNSNSVTPMDLYQQFQKRNSSKVSLLSTNTIIQCIHTSNYNIVEQKSLVTRFFYGVNRLDDAGESVIKELSALDKLLEKKPLSQQNCDYGSLTRTQKVCTRIKKECPKNKSNWKFFLRKAKDTFRNYKNLEFARKLIFKKLSKKERRDIQKGKTCSSKICQGYLSILDYKNHIVSTNSWIEGKSFLKNYKKIGVEKALKKQMLYQRRLLRKKINKYSQASRCLNSLNKSGSGPLYQKFKNPCELDKTLKVIKEAPSLQMDIPLEKNLASAEARTNWEKLLCLERRRQDRNKTQKIITHAVVDTALTAATMGLPALAARGLLLSHRASQLTMLAADSVFASKSAIEAHRACKENTDFKTELQEVKSCPSIRKSKKINNFDNCLEAKLLASLDLLPFLPLGFLKKIKTSKRFKITEKQVRTNADLNDEDRIKKANHYLKKYLGRRKKLTSTEENALRKAHDVGKGQLGKKGEAEVFNYTQAQLSEKFRILRKAGFTKKEIELLLEGGLAGQRIDIDPLASKLVSEDHIVDFYTQDKTSLKMEKIREGDNVLGNILSDFPDHCLTTLCTSEYFDAYKKAINIDHTKLKERSGITNLLKKCFKDVVRKPCKRSEIRILNEVLDPNKELAIQLQKLDLASDLLLSCTSTCPKSLIEKISGVVVDSPKSIVSSERFRKELTEVVQICSHEKNHKTCDQYLKDFREFNFNNMSANRLQEAVKIISRCLRANKSVNNCPQYKLLGRLKLPQPHAKPRAQTLENNSAKGDRSELYKQKLLFEETRSHYDKMILADLQAQFSNGDVLNKKYFELQHEPYLRKDWEAIRKKEKIHESKKPDYIVKIDGEWRVYDYYNPRTTTGKNNDSLSHKLSNMVTYKVQIGRQTNRVIAGAIKYQEVLSKEEMKKQLLQASAKLRLSVSSPQSFKFFKNKVKRLPNEVKNKIGYSKSTSDNVTLSLKNEHLEDVIVLLGSYKDPVPVRIFPYFDMESFERAYSSSK